MTERAEVEAQIERDLPFLSALGWAPTIAATGWIINHMEDIESDLSAFHRIDDYMTMPSRRFFELAVRLGAYSGVIAARAYEQSRENDERPAARSSGPSAEKPRVVPASVALAELEAEGWIKHRKGTVAA